MTHKAGFVNIIGKPNVGKSTLVNALTGEKVAIVTHKPQTTRHRILGILNEEGHQIVLSDTPGVIRPKYALHNAMMRYVEIALEDADVLLIMTEPNDRPEELEWLLSKVKNTNIPVYIIINKIDTSTQGAIMGKIKEWSASFPEERIIPISAIKDFNLTRLIESVKEHLPESPPYYGKDLYTDKTERFLASETIREKIFFYFQQEIPYSTEVVIAEFKEDDNLIRIMADVWVNRKSQKPILIGKGGAPLKKIGTQARKELEQLFKKQVYLELFVKVSENWREKPGTLRGLGYD